MNHTIVEVGLIILGVIIVVGVIGIDAATGGTLANAAQGLASDAISQIGSITP